MFINQGCFSTFNWSLVYTIFSRTICQLFMKPIIIQYWSIVTRIDLILMLLKVKIKFEVNFISNFSFFHFIFNYYKILSRNMSTVLLHYIF